MRFYIFALFFFVVAFFAVNGIIVDEKEGKHEEEGPEPLKGKKCMSNADCPRNEICLFPVPWHGEPGECG
uniref:Uncharacterized protein n=1 Tax=Panagrolaimus davidi TaxID=227884 RepID=A0A914Q6D3_9BILA